MNLLKRIVIAYFSYVLVFIIVCVLLGGQLKSILSSTTFWILPLFVILIGQLSGSLIFMALEKPQAKNKIFNISYTISFLGLAFTMACIGYSSSQHEKKFGNIEANQDHFKNPFPLYDNVREKIAFDSLSVILADPNSFRITGGSIKKIDTVIAGIRDTLYYTTMSYQKKNKEQIYNAKFEIFRDVAKMIYYDVPFDENNNRENDSLYKVFKNNVNDAMQNAPDSIKKVFKKDFSDMLNK